MGELRQIYILFGHRIRWTDGLSSAITQWNKRRQCWKGRDTLSSLELVAQEPTQELWGCRSQSWWLPVFGLSWATSLHVFFLPTGRPRAGIRAVFKDLGRSIQQKSFIGNEPPAPENTWSNVETKVMLVFRGELFSGGIWSEVASQDLSSTDSVIPGHLLL